LTTLITKQQFGKLAKTHLFHHGLQQHLDDGLNDGIGVWLCYTSWGCLLSCGRGCSQRTGCQACVPCVPGISVVSGVTGISCITCIAGVTGIASIAGITCIAGITGITGISCVTYTINGHLFFLLPFVSLFLLLNLVASRLMVLFGGVLFYVVR
jgi:hypothetical protein